MKLNAEQEKFINAISANKIKDANSFFAFTFNIIQEFESCPGVFRENIFHGKLDHSFNKIYQIEKDDIRASLTIKNKAILFEEDENEVLKKTAYFIAVLEFLSQQNLIFFVEKDANEIENFKIPVNNNTVSVGVHEHYPINDSLWKLIKYYVLLKIVRCQN